MSERHSHNEFEHNDDQESASFEADFDISTLLKPEEQASLRAQVEQSYHDRHLARTESAQTALDEVHKLYTDTEDTPPTPREVLVNGQLEKVIDAYMDARGNEWVELTDGRQTMTHQEVANPTPALEVEAAEVSVEGKDHSDGALEAVELHYKEVLATKNFDKESLGLLSPEPEKVREHLENEEINKPEEMATPVNEKTIELEQRKESKEELTILYNQLRKSREEFAHIQSREASNVDGAINELATLKRRLQQTSSGGIDPILHGRILQSVENARSAAHRVFRDEADKRALVRKAESIVDRTLRLDTERQHSGVQYDNSSLNVSAKTLQAVMNQLNNTDPRYYERQKSEFISIIGRTLRELEEVSDTNRSSRPIDVIASAIL